MKTIIFTLTVGLLLSTSLKSQSADILLPAKVEREKLVHHTNHSLSFNTGYVLSHWVSYKVTKSEVDPNAKIKAKYIQDLKIPGRSANKKDYKEGGYIMAQLMNHLEVAGNEEAVKESFYMSNIVPMKSAFYKFVWAKIEALTRYWSKDTEGLYVVCGPILKESPFTTIGENKVSIPKHYYKAIYDPKNEKAIGFIVKNGSTAPKLKAFAVSIDEIEKRTGLDLFPSLDDELEKKIEEDLDTELWDFEVK